MPDTFAASHLPTTSLNHEAAAESSAKLKTQKYANIVQIHIFIPVAIETSGVLSIQARELLTELGKRIFEITGEGKELPTSSSKCQLQYNVETCSVSRGPSSPTTSNFYLQMGHLTHYKPNANFHACKRRASGQKKNKKK